MPVAGRKPSRTAKKGVARKGAAPSVLVDALAEAAWTEADEALAEALVELRALEAARARGARDEAFVMLDQALRRAARKRGLSLFGAVGGRETYDPRRHEGVRSAKQVRIEAPGVARGGQVLIKARVSLGRARRP